MQTRECSVNHKINFWVLCVNGEGQIFPKAFGTQYGFRWWCPISVDCSTICRSVEKFSVYLCQRLFTKPSQVLCIDFPTYKTSSVIFIVFPFILSGEFWLQAFLKTGLFLVLYFMGHSSLEWGTCTVPAHLTL